MRDGIPERFRRLSRQKTPRTVGDRARDHYWDVDRARRKLLGDGIDGGLRVERVENGFDQERVDPAVKEPACLFAVGGAQLIEAYGAKAGIRHIGRDRGGAIGWPNGAGDETWAAILILRGCCGFAREPRAFDVKLVGDFGHAV